MSEHTEKILKDTRDYYGKVLQKSSDLKTNACCTIIKYPKHILEAFKNIHTDIMESYYGCGLVIPDCLSNTRIIDLGCGTGRDVYLLSQFVGENGRVLGVDMTDEQLNKANKYITYHQQKNKYSQSNVEFRKGYIELLEQLELAPSSYDIIVSNCVVNLSPNKEAVFQQVYNLLKTGGEFYFSDVYSSQRIPNSLKKDSVLWGECLSGALYWNDFIHLAKKCGFTDPRLVKSSPITIKNSELEKKVGNIKFYSATYRLFKLPALLEPDCEDYGQAVIYKGTINNHPSYWDLDEHHRIFTNKIFCVCGNTWNMLYHSRFAPHFEFIGNFENHYGIFEGCGKGLPFQTDSTSTSSCC
tara:strand:+ start:2713 stop:3777 length:1065 start_codon:yes stop_codon:yes gene_type:complete